MAQLAIKGHATRGKEVIQLLEMLGGVNKHQIDAIKQTYIYFIDIDGIIRLLQIGQLLPEQYVVYSLEEFLEKFPYKVGNKVIAYAEGCLASFTIQDMRWNSELNKVEYEICSTWLDASLIMGYCKEESMKEKPINHMSLANCDLDEVEIVLGDKFELKIKEGKYYAVKKQPKYPKTCEECLNVLGKTMNSLDNMNGYKFGALMHLQQLLICRDAYWKIAGEEMGLGKPWEPTNETVYCISRSDNVIKSSYRGGKSNILEFPTEKIRDTFYENFNDLINECKELL